MGLEGYWQDKYDFLPSASSFESTRKARPQEEAKNVAVNIYKKTFICY